MNDKTQFNIEDLIKKQITSIQAVLPILITEKMIRIIKENDSVEVVNNCSCYVSCGTNFSQNGVCPCRTSCGTNFSK